MAKTTKPAPPQPTAPANKSTEIITFNVGQAAIEQSRAHAATLTINGPEDKEGNAAVYKYRQVVRQQRILIEKQQAELKRPQIKFNRAVDLAAKSLIEPLEQIEEHLLKMETEYRKERERIADEAARNLRIRTDARVKQLQGLGMVYNPVNDCYELTVVAYFDGGAIPAGQSTVLFDDTKRLTDEEFMPIVDNVETYFKENREVYDQIQAETDRVAAEKLAQDEADRKELAELRAAKKRQKDEARKVQLAELIKHAEAEPAPPELADRDKAIKQEFGPTLQERRQSRK